MDGYVKHVIKVKNEGPAQDIYIGAHTWQDRTYGWYNSKCSEARTHKNYLWDNKAGSKDDHSFTPELGSTWMEPMRFDANETKEIAIALDYGKTNVAKDWSITAWGLDHKVVVTHAEGQETDRMP